MGSRKHVLLLHRLFRVIKPEDVEYTTAKTLADQGINQDDDLLDDFDARLKSAKKE